MRDQQSKELEVFHEFAKVSSLVISVQSISSASPPKPDIVCRVHGEGIVGFELVELIDPSFASRIDLQYKTKRALTDYPKNSLNPTKYELFKQRFSNAHLWFRFDNSSGFIKRSKHFPRIFDHLLDLPEGFEGETLKNDPNYLPTLKLVRVVRGNFVGPIFDPEAFGWLADKTKETILQKLSKTYVCDYPIELLAYIDNSPTLPEGVWRSNAEDAIQSQFAKSQFRRVWIYDCGSKTILFDHIKFD